MKTQFTILLLLSFFCSIGQTNLSFEEPTVLVEYTNAGEELVQYHLPLDYNTDDKMDLVGVSFLEPFLLTGNDSGGFDYLSIYEGYSDPILAIMDIDGDDDKDIITESNFHIREGDSFVNKEFPSGWRESIIAAADFDNNSMVDFVTIENVAFGNSIVRVYIDSSSTFAITNIDDDISNYDVFRTADIDNDGDEDILAFYRFGGNIKLWLNNGQGEFANSMDIEGSFDELDGGILQIADLDLDGDLDMVVSEGLDHIVVLKNDNGDFSELIKVENSGRPLALKFADLNNDGLLDIYYVEFSGNNLILHAIENKGSLSFEDPVLINSFPGSNSILSYLSNYDNHIISAFDSNNDGKLDIIFNSDFDNKIYLFKNNFGSTSTTDHFVDSSLSLYPIPAKSHISFDSELSYVDYNIYDINGNLVRNQILSNNKIQTTHLTSGSYILELITFDNKRTSKVIVIE